MSGVDVGVVSVESVRLAVEAVKVQAGDPEDAHFAEDLLYVTVLEAIAKGQLTGREAQECAKVALEVEDIDFPRWYA